MVTIHLHNDPSFDWLNKQVADNCRKYLIELGCDITHLNVYAQNLGQLFVKMMEVLENTAIPIQICCLLSSCRRFVIITINFLLR